MRLAVESSVAPEPVERAVVPAGPKAVVAANGLATAPAGAPPLVQAIIAAGNRIATKPYKYGGGHGKWADSGYDCSGSVSFALHGAGLLDEALDSTGFMSWGDAGPGQWVTIYAKGSHTYMVVAGLRFDTSGRARAGIALAGGHALERAATRSVTPKVSKPRAGKGRRRVRGGRARVQLVSMAARPRCFWRLVIASSALLAGCGEAPGPDYSLETPPREVQEPLQTPAPRAPERHREPRPSQRQAEHLRPVLAGWAAAGRRGDPDRAARYFAVPAIVAQSMTVELRTREQVRRFNDELPCGARLLEVQHDGRYIVGTFRLTERAGRTCAAAGQLTRVAFVIRARHFTEWRQVPDQRGAAPGPAQPEAALPAGGVNPT